jgi:hypothetical protein
MAVIELPRFLAALVGCLDVISGGSTTNSLVSNAGMAGHYGSLGYHPVTRRWISVIDH